MNRVLSSASCCLENQLTEIDLHNKIDVKMEVMINGHVEWLRHMQRLTKSVFWLRP